MSDAEQRDWQVSPTDTIVLVGKSQQRYVDRTATAIKRARLNSHYPSSQRLIGQLHAMGTRCHRGLYPELLVDVRTGLPTYREWTRVHTDVQMAPRVLKSLPALPVLEERAAREPGGIRGKELLKFHYYSDIADLDSTPAAHVTVALRRVDPDERTAHFHVVLDKLDASGVYVRFSIDLSQRSSFWNRSMLELDDKAAKETAGFRSVIYRLTGLDAEFTFVRLANMEGLAVERVIKGTVGPFFLPGTNAPEGLDYLWSSGSIHGANAMVASFSLDMASVDVARDGDNDPLDDLLTARLSEDGRAGYEESRKEHGYRVFKDRKFVVSSPELVEPVQKFCAANGSQNVIYSFRRKR